jgi:hypothetical protein
MIFFFFGWQPKVFGALPKIFGCQIFGRLVSHPKVIEIWQLNFNSNNVFLKIIGSMAIIDWMTKNFGQFLKCF